jgi:hypothetical protein
MKEPILIDNHHWNCDICGCPYDTYREAANCCDSVDKKSEEIERTIWNIEVELSRLKDLIKKM